MGGKGLMGGKGRKGRMGGLVLPLLPLLPLVLSLSGCRHAQAKSAPEGPPLAMPAPPPRDIAPIEAEAPAPVPLPDEPAKRLPARPRSTAPRADMPKMEPPVVNAQKPGEEPPKTTPPTTLQTTPVGAEGELERSIRATLSRASADLARVDYRVLNANARNQYDTAKRFGQQAEEALRAKNLVFAKNLADKAASLAAQLLGR